MTVKLTEEQKIKLLNSEDVYRVMHEILLREEKIDQEKEHFWLISMASNNGILNIELVSLGSVLATNVEPMNVYRVAVIKGAVKVIFVHNHPSGELTPTEEDKNITDRLIQVGRILNIQAIDHLIISMSSYMSFADTGLFEELKKSLRWVPPYEIEERIKKEEKLIREEAVKLAVEVTSKAEREKTLSAVVLQLKKKNLPTKEIASITGLSEEEINQIR